VSLGTHELVPGQLAVDIVAHQAGSMRCWSFVSRGLAEFGQREIVLTLSAGLDDNPNAPPTAPLSYYKTVYQLTAQGNLVDEQGFTGFGGAGMLGAMGLAYGRAIALDGVSIPPDSLAAVMLTGPEAALANSIGTTRVLTRLGRAYRYYPHPFWSDRGRQSVVAPNEQTLLSSVAIARVPGACASLDQTMVNLRLPRSAVPVLASLAQVPPNAGVGLMCGIDYDAGGHFVWAPGQQGPEAIQASAGPDRQLQPGQLSRMGGSFVMFVPEQQADSGQLFEDGFAFMLSDPSWARFRQALMAGRPGNLAAAPGALSLSLQWT